MMNPELAVLNTRPVITKAFSQERLVGWQSPANIALIKYWGKHGMQLPRNPSLSFSFKYSNTDLTVAYKLMGKTDSPKVDFLFDGKPSLKFKIRIEDYLNRISDWMPFVKQLHFRIESSNTFPHSTGIASSASSMSALALALCSIENDHFQTLENPKDFYRKASWLARLASGSAARSVYGGFSLWGKLSFLVDSTDEYAIPLKKEINTQFNDLRDAVLVVNSKPKAVSSSFGHALMDKHPYARQRYEVASNHLAGLYQALRTGDVENFIRITELEAMHLHALMMTSEPSFMLFHPSSLAIIQKIKLFRQQKGKMLCYTVDAGPNIHLLYPVEIQNDVEDFIKNDLIQHCENQKWIRDEIGTGPIRTK